MTARLLVDRMLAFVIVAAWSYPSVIAAQTAPTSTGVTSQTPALADRASDLDQPAPLYQEDQVALSASQIISILRDRPEVVVEIKTLIAQSQPGDIPTQPDAITDESLYSQIASSKDLRQQITMFLRARGYVSEADFSRTPARPRPYSDQLYADQPYSDQLSPL